MICLVSRRFHQHFGLVCKSIGTCISVRCVTFSRCCVPVNVVGSTLHFSGCCSLCDSSNSHYDYVCIHVHFTNISLLRCSQFFLCVCAIFGFFDQVLGCQHKLVISCKILFHCFYALLLYLRHDSKFGVVGACSRFI